MTARISLILFCLAALAAAPADAAERAMIVLDASGSMWGAIGGKPKLEVARDALKQVLGRIPPATELGLMAYGHRAKGDCADLETLVPPAAGTAGKIAAAAGALRFLGKTPLSEAVRRAADALRSTEGKATVILITDASRPAGPTPAPSPARWRNPAPTSPPMSSASA
jgi:Ca-activated chloride channel family protein